MSDMQPRVGPGIPAGGQFTGRMRSDSEALLGGDDDLAAFPPTRWDVEEAEARWMSLGRAPRPRYRGDWERANGGSGPTAGQVRAEASALREDRSLRDDLRLEYEKLRDAWQASDKSQDDRTVRCENCGAFHDRDDVKCPECSWS